MNNLIFTKEPDIILLKMIELINQKKREQFTFLGEGNDAEVYGFHQYAVKFKKINGGVLNDSEILKKIGDISTFPRLYAYKEDEYIIMERVKGMTLGELGLKSMEQLRFLPEELKHGLLQGIEQCFHRSVVPHDIHLHNVMYSEEENKLWIIDVGRFVEVDEKYVEESRLSYEGDCKFYQNISAEQYVNV